MNPSYYSFISFPAIDFTWNPARSFSIGALEVHFYGVIIAVGLLLAIIYACGRSKEFGMREDDLLDGVLCIVPFAVVCARLYYCIFQWEQYSANPIRILYIWEGGLAIYGGVIGAALGIIVFSRIKKIKLGAVLDITSLGFLIGQFIGRWGNCINREAFGAPTDSVFRMGLYNVLTGQVEYYHPTFLYESAWNFCGFLLLHFLSRRRKYDGQIALGYVAWYGLGRTFIEGLRMDSLYWGPVRVSQLLAAVSCFAAVVALVVLSFREHDSKTLFANTVSGGTAEAMLDEDTLFENAFAEAENAETSQPISDETETEEEEEHE